MENRSFLNIAHDIRQRITLTASDRFLAITTLSFDIAALEIFLPLMFGATVVLADQRKLQEENRFQHYLDTFAISLMQGTPSFWQQISQQYPKMPLPARVLCGGEALPTAVANWLARMTDGAWNVYGPTETTVWSMAYKLQVEQSRVTIGKPLSNTQCFVLDAKCTPLPPGVVGELYISGLGVARGYLGDQQLTDKSFLPNVFKSSCNPWFGQIMYKTGDRVRCLPCGNFEYLGRCDNQIKLRGHRIELGEIESIMQLYPGLQRAVVTLQPVGVDDPQQLFLAAYYQARAPIERQLLLDFLAALLPDYMLPNAYLFLEKLPLNANGKVDRNALPTVQFGAAGNYVAPITACQQDLCRIYQDILGAGDHRIGIMDDFFFLGGNSLSAIRLANRINRELKCDVKVKDIFSCKSIKNLAPLVEVGRGTFIYQDYLIESTAPESCFTPFPLSNIQQTYYFGRMKSFELSNVSTHIYSEFAFGYLDHQLLECSYNQLIARHHALRTIFENGEQRYLEAVPYYTIPYRKVQHESELIALREVFSHKVYSPERYPLFDIFITLYDEKYILHVSFDAIIIDMSSFKILFAEWIELYKNPETVFMPLEITYRDYQMQYERMRAGAIFERSLDYWQQKIDGYKLELNLPLAVPPSTIDNPHFRRLSAIVPTHVWQKIVSKCQQANVTPTVVILELYSRILCYWSGQDGLCLNLTLFNRLPLHPQVEAIIGDFTVLSLFNYQRCNTASMNEQLVKVHKELLSDMDNNLCDGVDVQRLLRQRRGLPSHAVITPVVLTSVLGMNDKANMFELPFNESYRGIDYAISQTSQVWLDHKAYETDEGFVAEWDYVEQLFDEQTIEAMHESYCRLIHWVAEHDWDCMAFPSPTLPSEQRLSIEGWNSTQAEFPPHTLHGLFDSYVDQPDVAGRTAVVETEGGHYNYGRLRDHVYSIGGALLSALPAGKGNVVAVLAEKGYLQVAATIGIMKSGGIYLPLHVAWPISRIDAILRQARCKAMLVSDSQYRYLQPALGQLAKWIKIIEIESPLRRPIPHPDVWPLVLPEDLAYIIFTSGSSGTPKGVAICHHGAVNTLQAVNKEFAVSANDSVLALSDLSFDLSVYDIFGMLAVGGTVVIPPQEKNRDPAHWLCMVRRHRITIWNSVPQLAELLADEAENSWQQLESLRLYLLSGDWLPLNLPDRLRGLSKEGLVISLGGATEGSIWSIWYHIATVDPGWRSIPYGTAMPNQQVLVLDSAGDPCPFGVVGEIYIGGVGVAHGYWRSEELTLKHFVNHPQWGRLYKTGDLGRWSKSGYIEFLGRHDAQVKLNGYRVELEDIENNLNKLPGIRQALVRKISRGKHWELAAHVVPTANQPVPLYFANRKDLAPAHGSMQPGVESSYSLAYPLEEELYLARKSVRQFAHDPLPQESVEQLCAAVLPGHQSQPGRELAEEQLRSLLSVCAALQVSDHALPKYRYPSAGRTYALQLHLGLPRNMGHYAKGYYRYNPLEQTLCVSALPTQCHQNESPYLDLIISWEAIEPLYPNRAFAFAHIEAGHMLALLTDRLGELGVVYQLQHPLEDAVAPGHSLACRLLFGRLGNDILPLPPSVRLSFMVRQGESYLHRQSGASYELESSSVLTAASDVSSILQQAQILVQIHGESTLRNYQECGWLLQYISIAALKQNIGSCLLGLTPSSDSLCSLVLGCIRQEDISSYVVPAKTISMASVINRHLAKRLPDYMLPQHYLLISELPLSSNGKVDASRLPDFVPTTQLVAPHSTGERRIQELWAELLVLDREEVGCDQSFFSIGGNSLQAMNLVRKIKLVLGADIRLDDLYQYNTVQKLATIIAKKSCNYDRETGSI